MYLGGQVLALCVFTWPFLCTWTSAPTVVLVNSFGASRLEERV